MAVAVVALCALLVATHLHDRRLKRDLEAATLETDELRQACADDIALLGADVIRQAPLDDLGELTDLAWGRARDLHAEAEAALPHAASPHQLEQITAALAQARQLLAEVQALVLDDETPPARPCCFFNPNHGPSDASVEWQTPTGRVILPCCSADQRRVESGADPYARTWRVGDDREPWWMAGDAVQPWARGWFGAWRGTPDWDAMQRAAGVLAAPPSAWDDAA